MADLIDGESISKLMEAFGKFQNKEGVIGTAELSRVLRHLGHSLSDPEVEEVNMSHSFFPLIWVLTFSAVKFNDRVSHLERLRAET